MIEKKPDHRQITVGKWTISEKLGIIESPEEKSFVLEPRLSRLFYLLALNDRSIISREYLTDKLWPDTIVNEESLTRAVADLRKFLAKNYSVPPTIETIRKRGYVLTLSAGPRMIALKMKLKKKHLYGFLGFAAMLLALLWIVN